MKILCPSIHNRTSERGSAVIVVMTMVAIMVICVSVNLVAIDTMDRELKLLDKKQVQHWQTKSTRPATNAATSEITAPSHDSAK
jgi:hypothetical protein